MNSDPFPSAARIAASEFVTARLDLDDPTTDAGSPGHDLLLHIADGNLVIQARHRDPDGTLHAIGTFRLRPTGKHVLLSGEGAERSVRVRFSSAAKARQFFRAEILHEPPSTKPSLVDLEEFASATADRLPGWTAQFVDITLSTHQTELSNFVWDLGTLHGAFQRYILHEAVILTGPDFTQLVAVRRPGSHDQLLVGALRPPAFQDELLHAAGSPVPMAIAVDRDPVRAASEIQQRLLPRYEKAHWLLRVHALTDAAASLERTEAENAAAGLTAAPPGQREVNQERTRNLRNADEWPYAAQLADSGPTLAKVAEHFADRIGVLSPRPAHRVEAALTRSAPHTHFESSSPAPVPPKAPPTVPRRSL